MDDPEIRILDKSGTIGYFYSWHHLRERWLENEVKRVRGERYSGGDKPAPTSKTTARIGGALL